MSISYRPSLGSWTEVVAEFNSKWDYWYIDWTIPGGADLGMYDVKVDVDDGDGGIVSRTDTDKLNVI